MSLKTVYVDLISNFRSSVKVGKGYKILTSKLNLRDEIRNRISVLPKNAFFEELKQILMLNKLYLTRGECKFGSLYINCFFNL